MIKNYICETCDKVAVCKVNDILARFHEEAKKDLGVNITIDSCEHNCSIEANDE